MYRILTFLLITTALSMCKSKKSIESTSDLIFVVLMEKDSSPKQLIKNLDHQLRNFKKSSKSQNQWTLFFTNQGETSKTIKRDLLNNALIITVYETDENGNMNLKSKKKTKVSPFSKQ